MRLKSLVFLCFLIGFPFVAISQLSVPQWVNGIGGAGSNSVPSGVISDSENNIYITGTFDGTVDFDPSAGIENLVSNGNFDVYVAKYTSAGTLIWAVSMGGDALDQESSNMAIDDDGNITIGGLWESSYMDADPGPGVFNLQNSGGIDGFIIHLDKDGKFLWAKSIGSSGKDIIHKIAVDNSGNIVAIGQFQSTINLGNTTLISSADGTSGLTAKFDALGNLIWAINLGESGYNETRGIAIDADNSVIVSGAFNNSTNFNPLGIAKNIDGGASSTFIAKYNTSGILIWVESVTGDIINNNTFVCVDSDNNIYMSAPFNSSLTFSSNKSLSPVGGQDFFLAKYGSDGSFQWTKGIGGAGASAYNYGIIISKDNYLYCSGYFNGTLDFNPGDGINTLTNKGQGQDFFLAKYDQDGNYKFAFNAGGGDCDNTSGRNLAIDSNNDLLLVGSFCSKVNFSAVTCSPYPLVAKSTRESFLAKYVQNVSSAQIQNFSVPLMVSSVIDQVNLRITVTVPKITDLTSLIPSIIIDGGTLSPASGLAQNFTSPVTYTLTNGCTSLNYLVSIITSEVKTVTICSGSLNTFLGDGLNTIPDTYLWEMLQDNNWVVAPGVSNEKDFTASGLLNPTTSDLSISIRRKVTTQNNSLYDSNYDVVIESGKQLDQPTVLVDKITFSTIKFVWNKIPDATGYEVSIDEGETFIDVTSVKNIKGVLGDGGLDLTFEGLDPETTIILIVRAIGTSPCVTSESSMAVTATTINNSDENGSGDVSIPNTFTPNGDGNNDLWYVKDPGIKTMKISVYNRWGNKIFETSDQTFGWDGRFNSSPLPVGVYYYYFYAIMSGDNRVQKKGTITIIR